MDQATMIPAAATGETTTTESPPSFEFSLGDLPAVREALSVLSRGFDNNRGIREAQRFQEWAANLETVLLAEKARDGADERSLGRMADAGGTRTRAEIERRKRRARTAARNPDLVGRANDPAPGGDGSSDAGGGNDDSRNNGALNSAQLDALGWADLRTDGAAALDADLITLLSKLSADQAMREARRWAQEHNTSAIEERQKRQRARRCAYRTSEGEYERIVLEGDKPSLDEIWARIEAEADRLYHDDGGRDIPADRHPRTRGQRLFDAAAACFTRKASASRAAASRATLVLTTTVENAAAGFTDPVEMIGSGPVNREFLGRLLPDTEWAGMLYSQNGHPLWLGRSLRHATLPQWLALAIRDRGCVLCGAAPSRCQAHHTMPWEAPGRGETNVDQLWLLCTDCHHQLHHNRQTLEWDREIERWRTRPALPHEIPPAPTG